MLFPSLNGVSDGFLCSWLGCDHRVTSAMGGKPLKVLACTHPETCMGLCTELSWLISAFVYWEQGWDMGNMMSREVFWSHAVLGHLRASFL
jgi:hypothetical protein